MFVFDGEGRQCIDSLPGVDRLGSDQVCREAAKACELGIPAIAVFPATDPRLKTEDAREAINADNLVCRTIRAIRQEVGDQLGLICDVALDPYSSHGQDGLVRDGDVVNDETIEVLCLGEWWRTTGPNSGSSWCYGDGVRQFTGSTGPGSSCC